MMEDLAEICWKYADTMRHVGFQETVLGETPRLIVLRYTNAHFISLPSLENPALSNIPV